jgi:hypothetical protein
MYISKISEMEMQARESNPNNKTDENENNLSVLLEKEGNINK